MNDKQKEAVQQSLVEWLSHPGELGKIPAKIEHVGEFELHGLRYHMFKFKKSLLSLKWLLGVCGGYEGDGREHCGHVFSEMQQYVSETAREQSIAMVEMIREHWMREAARSEGEDGEEGKGGPFVSFVLLNSASWNSEKFAEDLEKEWGIVIRPEDGVLADKDSFVWDMGDNLLATVALMSSPVPDGEAEHNAASNYMWPEAVDVTKTHVAHLMVAVLDRNAPLTDAGQLLVQLCDACLLQDNAIGVYTAGTVFQPELYRDCAAVMHDDELPFLNWVYFGFSRAEKGYNAYTYGLSVFGKDELEVLDSSAEPQELHSFLFNIAAYVISSDVTLRDGETLGATEEERISITRSEGVCLDGQTLKIGYKPSQA